MDYRRIFSFPVMVNGIPLTATVIAQEAEDRDFHYRVRFSDGYEDVFHKVDDRLLGLRGEGSQSYADAVKFDVEHYIGWDPGMFWEVFSDEIDGERLNIWVFQEEEEDEEDNIYTIYKVYAKGLYRFHLMKVGDGWMMSSHNREALTGSYRKLAEKVEDLLIAIL